MFDVNAVYPDYLTDLNTLICPSSHVAAAEPFTLKRVAHHHDARVGEVHPDCVSSLFYVYTGYMVLNDEQAIGVYTKRQKQPGVIQAHRDFAIPIPVSKGSHHTYASSNSIPVVWDRMFVDERAMAHQDPLGGNVLHLDGHVRFVTYSSYNNTTFFPITRLSAEPFGTGHPRLSPDCYSY